MSPHLSLLITLGLLLTVVSSRAPVEEGPKDKYCGTFLWARIRGLKDQCATLKEEYGKSSENWLFIYLPIVRETRKFVEMRDTDKRC